MEWQWNTNGKRFKVAMYEDTKKKRIGSYDVNMEEDNAVLRIYRQKLQFRLDREIALYRQQVRDTNYTQCCNK